MYNQRDSVIYTIFYTLKFLWKNREGVRDVASRYETKPLTPWKSASTSISSKQGYGKAKADFWIWMHPIFLRLLANPSRPLLWVSGISNNTTRYRLSHIFCVFGRKAKIACLPKNLVPFSVSSIHFRFPLRNMRTYRLPRAYRTLCVSCCEESACNSSNFRNIWYALREVCPDELARATAPLASACSTFGNRVCSFILMAIICIICAIA